MSRTFPSIADNTGLSLNTVDMAAFILLIIGVTVRPGYAVEFEDEVARVHARGHSLYIPVTREWVQGKLDKFVGPALYQPERPVFKNQPVGTHLLLIDIADVHLLGTPEAFSGPEVTISIPFLSVTPGGPTCYSLGLVILYELHRLEFPHTDFLYEYMPVERISLNDRRLILNDGGDAELHIMLTTKFPCDDIVAGAGEFDGDCVDRARSTFTTAVRPDFRFCVSGRYSSEGTAEFCDPASRLEREVLFGHDTCTTWTRVSEKYCGTVDAVASVGGWLRDNFIPLEGPVRAVVAEQFSGEYTIGVASTCV